MAKATKKVDPKKRAAALNKLVVKKHPATGEKPVGKIKSNEEVRQSVKATLPAAKVKSCIWCGEPLLVRSNHGEGICDTGVSLGPTDEELKKEGRAVKATNKKAAEYVAPEDHPKGKGLAKAIRNPRNEVDDMPEAAPDDNTAADQRRRKDAALAQARKKVLELPTSPEGELILKSTTLPPDVRVMRYHNSNQWQSCLLWIEREDRQIEGKPIKGKKALTENVIVALHVIRQADDGALIHEKKPPRDAMHFAEIIGGYPIGPAINHFRGFANRGGGSKKVRELLGLSGEPPIQYVEEIVRDDGGRAIGTTQVPKPPKGGNSNKPTPNAQLDELYERSARLLGTTEQALREKYGHLNNGLQGMNLRNRLKAKGHNT